METYICNNCGYAYDPVAGDSTSNIEAGIPYGALPDDWVCPQCGNPKAGFEPETMGESMDVPLATVEN